MTAPPHVILSAAVSLDGYLDDDSPRRLVLSGPEDLDEVDALRATCDAILVGAGTVRADDPRLLVRSPARRDARREAGRAPTPLRVVLSRTGDLPRDRALFVPADGAAAPLVLTPSDHVDRIRAALTGVAEVGATGTTGDAGEVVRALAERGVRRLLVEGGTAVNTAFLTAGVVDELRLAVAPVLVGRSAAPRLIADGEFPWGRDRRARLTSARAVGDTAVLTYDLGAPVTTATDRDLLLSAITESRRSPESATAYSVGAIVTTGTGEELARGHSRETDPHDHAEEVALARLRRRGRTAGASGPLTLYSSLEPCTRRRSRPVPCADLVVAAGISRVVIAAREPDLFADCQGVETLTLAGIEVVELDELAGLVRAANAHLPAWRQTSRR